MEKIAKICHEANRAYCETLGDWSQPTWENAPDWQKKSAINGVVLHLAGDVSPKDSHDNWVKDKLADGWVFGTKDPEAKTHPCIVVYEKLPIEQRRKDYIFKAIVESFKN